VPETTERFTNMHVKVPRQKEKERREKAAQRFQDSMRLRAFSSPEALEQVLWAKLVEFAALTRSGAISPSNVTGAAGNLLAPVVQQMDAKKYHEWRKRFVRAGENWSVATKQPIPNPAGMQEYFDKF
jgi:hypothetical protein